MAHWRSSQGKPTMWFTLQAGVFLRCKNGVVFNWTCLTPTAGTLPETYRGADHSMWDRCAKLIESWVSPCRKWNPTSQAGIQGSWHSHLGLCDSWVPSFFPAWLPEGPEFHFFKVQIPPGAGYEKGTAKSIPLVPAHEGHHFLFKSVYS